jgi:hypothetical protein
MINVYSKAAVEVDQDKWILLYQESSKEILMKPQQCGGLWTVVETLVVADTKEELNQYIIDNNLSYPHLNLNSVIV